MLANYEGLIEVRSEDAGGKHDFRGGPAWDQVTAQFAAMPYVPTLEFMARINDVALLFKNLLALYETRGRPELAYRMHRGVLEVAREFFDESAVVNGMSVEARMAAFEELLFVNTNEKLAQFELRIVNQGLVSLCTVLDEFLCRVVDAIARAKPEVLYGSDAAKKISLKSALELGTVEALSANVRAREVTRFSHLGIEKKFRYLAKLGLSEDRLFNSATLDPNFNQRISGWRLPALVEIYDQRNTVVHRDALALQSFEQVSDIVDFFNRICMLISVEVPRVYPGVPNEFTRDAMRGQAYRELHASPPVPPGDADARKG